VLLLLGVGFLGGVITGISPCVIPVLPVIAAGGSTSTSRRRPIVIISGLVASFAFFTLVGGTLLSLLHLPQDVLEYLGVALLLLLAIGLLVPRVGELIERPFARLGTGKTVDSMGAFVLGASLGLVFTPCAGPVLAAIDTVVANHRIGLASILFTVAFALGAGIPLLILAVVAQRTITGWKALRQHLPTVRKVSGVVLGVVAIAILFNWTGPLKTAPGYTSSLQHRFETAASVKSKLHSLAGEKTNIYAKKQAAAPTDPLPNEGPAATFVGITQWLNTPGGKPLTLSALRGKVVLVDFWTYSCINCQRSLPHVEAWYAKYHQYGLEVVGVHTPEFPFEHVVSNVAAAVTRLGVKYPVAIDDTYKTWDAYNNTYWPAEYLIDQNGIVRHTDFGEGMYGTTENDIRLLLSLGGAHDLPPPTDVPDRTPSANQPLTTETYLGSKRFDVTRYVGSPSAIPAGRATTFTLSASVPDDAVSFGGTWTQHTWDLVAGKDARIELYYMASDVYLVLGGTGTVGVSVNGKHTQTVHVSGVPDLYTMASFDHYTNGLLSLSLSPGVQAYDFTFG
jgi:cytochrome c biogenesis protein CcdA/thiol-disulfide isomerase/thioredoxin